VDGFPKPGSLRSGWKTSLDGAAYGQPIVIGSMVVVATENNTIYGLDLNTGRQRWRRHLSRPIALSDLPCGNIDPLGITGTPAYDRQTDSVFVTAETTGGRHDLVSLDRATGQVRFTRNLDVTDRDQLTEQQRSALAVANGRVYVSFGGLFGDCGNYVGYVAAVDTRGARPTEHYEVPTEQRAGIWAPSGPAVDSRGDVYVAVGNGKSTGGAYDGSDAVLRLKPDLSDRLDYFAPSSWGSENAEDADLGSTGPLLLPDDLALIAGKAGDVFLLDTTRLGGIGGAIDQLPDCTSFGGMAYHDGAAFLPCTDGVLRVDINGRKLSRGWQSDGSINGSPVIGGGAVWTLDTGSGTLHALDESTGRSMATAEVGDVSRFASPVLTGNRVLIGTMKDLVALEVG
jgi:outer membrane protein assembly factor BamB